MKYESNILERLIKTYGVVGNPKYVSEIIKQFIIQGKECYPNLFTYQSDWLAHIDEFGLANDYVVTYTGQRFYAPNTKESPVKRAILNGCTLVNLFNDEVGEPTAFKDYNIISVKENTKYIIFIDLTSPDSPTNTIGFLNEDGSAWRGVVNNVTSGISKHIIETKSGVSNKIRFHTNKTGVVGTINRLMIIEYQEGMENWDIPYFEGMQSVKMPVLTTTGKNLFDIKNIDKFYQSTNKVTNTYKIRLKPNTNYTMSSNVPVTNPASIYFNGTKTDVNGVYINAPKTAMSDNDGNLIFYIRVDDLTGIKLENFINNEYYIQLEEGTVATTYEPYKSNILTVNEEVELRGIGDVHDELDCLTGEVSVVIDEYILTGNENWSLFKDSFSNMENSTLFKTTLNLDVIDNSPCLSADLNNENVYSLDRGGIFFTTGGQFRMRVMNADLTTTDVNGLKTYLQNNNFKFLYVKAQEVIKTVDLNIKDQNNQVVNHLTSFEGGTHFDTSSQTGSVLPTLEVDVVVDLEETLKTCSLEGNTM